MKYIIKAVLMSLLFTSSGSAETPSVSGLFMKKDGDCIAYLDVTHVARQEALLQARRAAFEYLKVDEIGGCNKKDNFVFMLVSYASYDEYARPKFGSMEILEKFKLSGSVEQAINLEPTPELLAKSFPSTN